MPTNSRAGANALVMLAAAAIVAAGIRLASGMIAPLLVAACITAAVHPIFRWVHRFRVSDVGAVIVALLVMVALLGLIGWLFAVAVLDLSRAAWDYARAIRQFQLELAAWFGVHGQAALAEALRAPRLEAFLADGASGIVMSVPSTLSLTLTVLFLVLFMLLEGATLPHRLKNGLNCQPKTLHDLAQTLSEVQRYLSVKTATSAATGLGAGLWCAVCGVPNAVLWGLVTFVLHYIPMIGSLIASIPPVLIALASYGAPTAALVGGGFALLNLVVGNVIEPRALGRALSLTPLVVLLSMFAWGWLLGPIGALLSVPLTLIVKIILWNTEDLHWVAVLLGPTPAETTRPTFSGTSSVSVGSG
jgi:AI-2 transport protein TqsA